MTGTFISPIRANQIPAAARVMANAFANAPRYTFLLPNNAQRQARLPWVWGATIRACVHSGGAVYVAHGGSGDAVLGVAIWGSPEEPKHSALTLLRSGLWACARPARHPGLAATASSCARARRAQTAWPVLVPQRHRC